MTKFIMPTVLMAAALIASTPTFAADCAAEMKATEAAIAKVSDSGKRGLATQKLLLARERMAERNEAACLAQIKDLNKDINFGSSNN